MKKKLFACLLCIALIAAATAVFFIPASAEDITIDDFTVSTADAVAETKSGLQLTTSGGFWGGYKWMAYDTALTVDGLEYTYTVDSYGGTPGDQIRYVTTLSKSKGVIGWGSPEGYDPGKGLVFYMIPEFVNGENADDGYTMFFEVYEYPGGSWSGAVTAFAKTQRLYIDYGEEVTLSFRKSETLGLEVYANGSRLKTSANADIDFSFVDEIVTDGKAYFSMTAMDGANEPVAKMTLNKINGAYVSSIQEEPPFVDGFKLANFDQYGNLGLITKTADGINMTASGAAWNFDTRPSLVYKKALSLDGLTAEFTMNSVSGTKDDLYVVAIGISENGGPLGWPTPLDTGDGYGFFVRTLVDEPLTYIEGVAAMADKNLAMSRFSTQQTPDTGFGQTVKVQLKADDEHGYLLVVNGVVQTQGETGEPINLNILNNFATDGKAFVSLSILNNEGGTFDVTFTDLGVRDVVITPVVEPTPPVETGAAKSIKADSAELVGIFNTSAGAITERGFEWKKDGAAEFTKLKIGDDAVSAVLTGLSAKTKYVYKAYAVIDGETVYGEEMDFTTREAGGTPDTTQATPDTTKTPGNTPTGVGSPAGWMGIAAAVALIAVLTGFHARKARRVR